MKLISWSISDVGRKRDHNEDSYLIDESLGLYAVADGMGGHQGGDQASRMAVEVLREEIQNAGEFEEAAKKLLGADPMMAYALGLDSQTTDPGAIIGTDPTLDGSPKTGADEPTNPAVIVPPPAAALVLKAAARACGRAIYDAAAADPRLNGMGTTLTAMLVHGGRVHFAHVGDSRAFLFRDGKIEQVTQDHSWIAEQVKAGVMTESEAKESKFRHIITRSVGFEREVDVDIIGAPVVPGDCFLMCSDGMSNYVENDELGRILSTTYFRRVPQLLVDLANDRGGDDNITVVLVCAANDLD
jgi:protein phosphatase